MLNQLPSSLLYTVEVELYLKAMMVIRKAFKGMLQTSCFSRHRSTSGASVLLAVEGRLAKAQENSELRQVKVQESLKSDLVKAQESLKVDLAKAQENSELRQVKAQESLKEDLAKAQESMKAFIKARDGSQLLQVIAAVSAGAGIGISAFYWAGGEILSPWKTLPKYNLR